MRAQLFGQGPCVSVRVPAKLNLFLAVRGRRPDGYHELVTVFQTLSLYDRVRVGLVGPPGQGHHPAARRRMRLRLWHDGGTQVPIGEDNLAVQAARRLGAAAGVLDLAVVDERAARLASPEVEHASRPCTVIDLRKGIPVAGGMAGGSADAAATLVALNELWGCELSRDRLRELAVQLGSDVPFCLAGGTALATGRGTALAEVLCSARFAWVVCQAREPLATADVYRSWDRRCAPADVSPDGVLAALRAKDPAALGAALHNDLEPAAFALRPELRDARDALLEAGALGSVLSGSGPTLVALCASTDAAAALAERVRARFAQVTVASSPAGGPDLVPC